MIFLCSPFSHPDLAVRQSRADAAWEAWQRLTLDGHIVFSPIAVGVALCEANGMAHDDPWWYHWSLDYLRASGEVWVLMLDGWRSIGVLCDITEAEVLGMAVRYVDPNTLEVRDEP